MHRWGFVVVACLVAGAAPARGQIVRGVVLDEATAAPVEGAMVILTDVDGVVVHRVLTDAAGAFIADADRPGPHRVRVDRIGFRSLTTEPFPVPVDGTFRRVLVGVEPVRLSGLDVEGARRCQVRPEEGVATASVWEEIRKALEAARWTIDSGVYRYTLLKYTRRLDRDGRQIVREDRSFSRGRGQAPYVSLPAGDLVEKGFVQPSPEGGTAYYAPDAGALLSDPFLDTHCMRLTREEGRLGLEFEPVEGRDTPDIEGVIWIDAEHATLDRLEFRYVNLSRGRIVGRPGGFVSFGRLPNGTWIVRDWGIRMPLLAALDRGRMVRLGYQEDGGVVWRVVDREGTALLEAGTASLAGVVTTSDGAPAVDAAVEAVGTGATTPTEHDGSFLLTGLPPGRTRLRVRHPSLDTLGLVAAGVTVEAEPGTLEEQTLRVPSPPEVLTDACGGAPRAEGTQIVLGRVRDPAGAPATGAEVRLTWLSARPFQLVAWSAPPSYDDAEPTQWRPRREDGVTHLETTTDARGIFLLCDAPVRSQFRFEAWLPGGEPSVRTVTLSPGPPTRTVTLNLEKGGVP